MARPTSSRQAKSGKRSLPAMADVDDVAIFDDVVLAFDVELAVFLELHLGGVAGIASPGQFAVLHYLGADETPGDVRMDRVGCLDGTRAVADGPGANFVFAGGEEEMYPSAL